MSGIVYRCKKKKNKVKKKIEKNKNQEKRKGKKAELEINKDAQKRKRDGQCQTKEVIYQATVVEQNTTTKTYTGLTRIT